MITGVRVSSVTKNPTLALAADVYASAGLLGPSSALTSTWSHGPTVPLIRPFPLMHILDRLQLDLCLQGSLQELPTSFTWQWRILKPFWKHATCNLGPLDEYVLSLGAMCFQNFQNRTALVSRTTSEKG